MQWPAVIAVLAMLAMGALSNDDAVVDVVVDADPSLEGEEPIDAAAAKAQEDTAAVLAAIEADDPLALAALVEAAVALDTIRVIQPPPLS